ncbi:Transcriptional regulator, AsnC family [Roseibacterium elongatum DSM 19469]|uniref:Transcriptional regulator, AsnC family n=1 Tax=Roseicyclus elongatus DSM 19469 TaxID=1294273 RepID=W8SNR0_9RHOB|nr:Lrp/AsnC family transcriptional regulator [Roseibacterium elongatum]AHM04175.1 Transcriptional regulator, AsnC family [Roseibacterium elongatum DSM 19469]
MDKIDSQIIAQLQQNARLSITDLADRVGLTPTPCARRVQRLEEDGIITGYTARVDAAKLGLPLTVFIFVELERQSHETLRNFETAIRRFDEVVECHLMTGTRDILLKVVAPDLKAFDRFLEDHLVHVPGIRATRSSFSLRTMVSREVLPRG